VHERIPKNKHGLTGSDTLLIMACHAEMPTHCPVPDRCPPYRSRPFPAGSPKVAPPTAPQVTSHRSTTCIFGQPSNKDSHRLRECGRDTEHHPGIDAAPAFECNTSPAKIPSKESTSRTHGKFIKAIAASARTGSFPTELYTPGSARLPLWIPARA
jgi:hypothetical protein